MLGSVNNFIQNSFTQPTAEKKTSSSSEKNSDFEKSLANVDKKDKPKSSPIDLSAKSQKSKENNKLNSEENSQSENSEMNNSDAEENVEAKALPNPEKLTPGDRMAPGPFKEAGPSNAFFQNAPYKTENKNTSAPEEAAEGADELTKKLAMQSFMKRMKDELGVEPSKVVKAFTSLTMEEMTRPPEENVTKIIQSLGLNEQQQLLAQKIFDDMLKQTASQSMADYLKSSGRDLSLNVMTDKEIKQQKMSQALDNMNSKFFGAQARPVKQEESRDSALLGSAGLMKSGADTASAGSAATSSAAAPAPMSPMMTADAQESLMKQMRTLSPEEQISMQAQLKDILSQQSMPTAESLQVPAKVEAPMMAGAAGAAMGAMALMGGEDQENLDENFGENASSDLNQLAGLNNQGAIDKKDASFASVLTPQAMQQADSSNVKELIDQAQYLARRGGGEMKIKLNPDGMGEVTMKVVLADGQLQVQMVTDSNEAKKMIERGLGELKATLASHQLNVDQIKVDSTQTSLEKQMAQHQEDSQRQSARQFMEQFRQDSSGWKRNFYDIPTARSYRTQREDAAQPGLSPQAISERNKSTSRRINLVA